MSKKPAKKKVAPAPPPEKKAEKKGAASAALQWTQHGKSTWLAPDPGGDTSVAGGRITMVTNKWKDGPDADPSFSCYRDGKYLGTDPTLESAKRRVQYREQSATVLQDTVQGGLPKFLAISDAERALERARVAPPRARAATVPLPAAPQAPPDAAVAKAQRQRAELAGPPPGARPRMGRGAPPGAAVIRVVTKANPRKAGTGQATRYDTILQHDGKTVAEYVAAQGDIQALKYALEGGHVKLEG